MRKFTYSPRLFTISSILFALSVILIIIVISCRKVNQQQTEEIKADDLSVKFFTGHSSSDPVIAAAARFVKGQNEKYKFLNNLTKKIGFPYWDKSMIIQKKEAQKGSDGSSSVVVFVPFARDSQQLVNSALRVTMTQTDTVFKLLYDWQYADTTATGMKKKDLALVLMQLDKSVFDHTMFKITDSSLFSNSENPAKYVKLTSMTGTDRRGGVAKLTEDGYILTICYTQYVPANQGQLTPCPSGSADCNVYTEELDCEDIYLTAADDGNSGDFGGGGASDPGSGGGDGDIGGGGGGSGWQPVPPTNNPPANEPIDSMITRYYKSIKTRTDSLLAKSLRLNWEHSMIIVQNGDSIYLKNEKTSQDSLSTEVDFTLTSGEILLGYIHCHSSASLNVNDRSAPSGSDLQFLSQKLSKNFVQFTECGNTAYALVIEDPAKAKIFLDSKLQSDLNELLINNALQIPSWFNNWQNATQISLNNFIGSTSLNGFGLYKSTDSMRQTWTKLNP